MNKLVEVSAVVAAFSILNACAHRAGADDRMSLKQTLDEIVEPLMREHKIPGMIVGISLDGEQKLFSYGVASLDSRKTVSAETIFEIGSVSKTFTGLLAASAQVDGALDLSDKVTKHVPELRGSSFDQVSLLDLGTYSAGGLPLQFPDSVSDKASMIDFYRAWEPKFSPATFRQYSNPSIGLLGYATARAIGQPFDVLMEQKLFPSLGLTSTHMTVPAEKMSNYAWGYNRENTPIRVNPGMLASEAYGVKTTASDLLKVVEANMSVGKRAPKLKQAIATTHRGQYRVGPMTQALGWEIYAYPTSLSSLLAGNSPGVIFEPRPASRLNLPFAGDQRVLLNKTGSTNGFGAYVAFIPAKKLGIVILANKNYPIPARVTAAHRILSALDPALRTAAVSSMTP